MDRVPVTNNDSHKDDITMTSTVDTHLYTSSASSSESQELTEISAQDTYNEHTQALVLYVCESTQTDDTSHNATENLETHTSEQLSNLKVYSKPCQTTLTHDSANMETQNKDDDTADNVEHTRASECLTVCSFTRKQHTQRCFDTLTTATPKQIVYYSEVQQHIEDKTHADRVFNTEIIQFTDYYIQAYYMHRYRTRDSVADKGALRETMFTLAAQSVDVHVAKSTDEHAHGILESVEAKFALERYFIRQVCMAEYHKHKQSLHSVSEMRDFFMNLLQSVSQDMSIILAIDVAMFNIVRRAKDYAQRIHKDYVEIAREYLVSAMAQIAFVPSSNDIHVRTYKQKCACIQYINLNSYLCGLIMESIVLPTDNQEAELQTTKHIHITLSHILVLGYLSHENYIINLIMLQTRSYANGEQYVQSILQAVEHVEQEEIESYLHDIMSELNKKEHPPVAETTDAYKKIYTQVIGQVLRHDSALCAAMANMYTRVYELPEKDYDLLVHFVQDESSDVPTTYVSFHILYDMWKLENSLYDAYVHKHKLTLQDLHHTEGMEKLLDKLMHMSTCDLPEEEMTVIKNTLTSPYLNKHNDPNLRSYTGALVEFCDPDHRMCDLYAINADIEQASYTGSALWQSVRNYNQYVYLREDKVTQTDA